MGDKDRRDHQKLVQETGRFRLSKEQEDTISVLMDGVDLTLEENVESTLELPQLRSK